MNSLNKRAFGIRLAGWTLFALGFGYTEAILVVYARRMLSMPPGLDYGEIFRLRGAGFDPAMFTQEFAQRGLYEVELIREGATLLMLAGVALAASPTGRGRIGVFLYTFALWDLAFYAFLKLTIGFPRTWSALDVYFLVPIVWFGPVWFPILLVMPVLLGVGLWLTLTERDYSKS